MAKGRKVPPPAPPVDGDEIDPQERAAQLRFIKERWEALAALAWESYQAEGRGAVVLHVVSTQGPGKTEAVYVSARGLQQQGQPWPDPDTERLAAEYQPEHEIVIVVERENGGASTYRMAAQPSPPEAYRRRERNWRAPSTI